MSIKLNRALLLDSAYRTQKGVGLIEVLISLLVISAGVLGLTALQLNSFSSNRTAYFRTQATVLAYDMIDRQRSNENIAKAGGYVIDTGAASGSTCNDNCSPADIATTDLLEWKTQLAAQLPNGDGFIAATPGIDDGFDVTVQWADADNTTKTLTIGMQL